MGAATTRSDRTPPGGSARDFTYITPRGRRLSEYEAVTCYTQPSSDAGGLERAGWFLLRPDLRPMFDVEGTRARCADWFAFRDPNQMWQRPYYVLQSDAEKAIETATRTALAQETLASVDPDWAATGLMRGYLAFARLEYALYRSLSYASRESLSDTLNSVTLFNASDKLRHAQAIILLGLDLEGVLPGFEAARGERAWLEDEEWQPARRLAEKLMATNDWVEVVTAANLVLEPLVVEPLCRWLFSIAAGRHGDGLTPVVAGSALADSQRNRRWTDELVRHLLADESHGPENRRCLEEWVAEWSPPATEMMEALGPVFGPLLSGTTMDELIREAVRSRNERLGGLGLTEAVNG